MSLPSLYRWIVLAIVVVFVAGVSAVDAFAQIASYNFSGHLEVSTNLPDGDPRQGLPFTAQLSYSTSPNDYSSDWQVSNTNWGEYESTPNAVSLQLHFTGSDYLDDPRSPVSEIDIRNDSGLFYSNGIPALTGDQLGIWQRTILPITVSDGVDTFTFNESFLLEFYASDTSGTVFNDDSLRTLVDFPKFDDLRIQIVPVIPVNDIGGVPSTASYYDNVEGIIDSVQAVPEPATVSLVFLSAFSLLVLWIVKSRANAPAHHATHRACAGWFVDHMRIIRQVGDAADDLAEAQGEINRLNGNSRCDNVLRSLPQAVPYTVLLPVDNMPSLKTVPKYSIPKMSGGITGDNGQNSQN